MTPESSPPDRSDSEGISAKEELRRTVLDLTSREGSVDEGYGSRSHVTPLPDGLSLEAYKNHFSPEAFKSNFDFIFPENILKLSIYETANYELVESIAVSDGDDETVFIAMGEKEQDFLDPHDREKAETYIRDFFARYRIENTPPQ